MVGRGWLPTSKKFVELNTGIPICSKVAGAVLFEVNFSLRDTFLVCRFSSHGLRSLHLGSPVQFGAAHHACPPVRPEPVAGQKCHEAQGRAKDSERRQTPAYFASPPVQASRWPPSDFRLYGGNRCCQARKPKVERGPLHVMECKFPAAASEQAQPMCVLPPLHAHANHRMTS